MSLEVARLRVGDQVICGRSRQDDAVGGKATVVFVGSSNIVVLERPDGSQFLPDKSAWTVYVPPPPCPIKGPVTLFRALKPHVHVWSETTAGRYLGADTDHLTLLPEGVEPAEGQPWAKYTWGEP